MRCRPSTSVRKIFTPPPGASTFPFDARHLNLYGEIFAIVPMQQCGPPGRGQGP
jgi:hypothetical protein